MFDIAIIGTGLAGISAALTAKARNKNIILLGNSDLSSKLSKAPRIDNYPGLPAVKGSDFAKILGEQLRKAGIQITDARVNAVYAMGTHFAIQAGGNMYESQAVVLGIGVSFGKPYPGEEEFLGRGVSYCATCDGMLYRGRRAIVIADGEDAVKETEFLASILSEVIYIPIGKTPLPKETPNIKILSAKPLEIKGSMKAGSLITDKEEISADIIFIIRDNVKADRLVPGLQMDGPHVKVDVSMRTNIPGLFAAGDLAGKPYQYVKAAGQGNTAVLSAISYIEGKK